MPRITLAMLACALLIAMPANASEGKIAKMARKVGATACLPTIAKLEGFLGNKRNYGSWSFWSSKKPPGSPSTPAWN